MASGVYLYNPDLLGGDGGGNDIEVVIREGDARLDDENGDALVILGSRLIETLVTDALLEAELSFELEDIQAQFVEQGIEISGRVDIRVSGVPLSPRFTAVVHPTASDGRVSVEVGEVRAAGTPLPQVFRTGLEGVINQEIGDAISIDGYVIDDVEVGDGELLVYLVYAPEE
ncbi:MAG: hypothetical protein WEB00_00065 [Dehalococcoidia bacterium]